MIKENEEIANLLKAARERAGISQTELSRRAGTPQTHLSKIENGKTDVRASTLIELARSMGHEVILIPHRHLHAVRAIMSSGSEQRGQRAPLSSPAQKEAPAAYTLDDDD